MLLTRKKETEEKFTAWVNEDSDRKAKYGEALKLIEEAYADVEDDKAMEYMAEALLRGPEIFLFANRAKTVA